MPKIRLIEEPSEGGEKFYVAIGRDDVGAMWAGAGLLPETAKKDLEHGYRGRRGRDFNGTIRVYEITED